MRRACRSRRRTRPSGLPADVGHLDLGQAGCRGRAQLRLGAATSRHSAARPEVLLPSKSETLRRPAALRRRVRTKLRDGSRVDARASTITARLLLLLDADGALSPTD